MATYLFELLPEVVVEPGVEEGVVARGGHGDGVSDEEAEVVIPPVSRRDVHIIDEVDEVQRKPGHSEDGHHSDEHPIGPPFPLPVCLLLPVGLGAWL